jgi:hypothetical protein
MVCAQQPTHCPAGLALSQTDSELTIIRPGAGHGLSRECVFLVLVSGVERLGVAGSSRTAEPQQCGQYDRIIWRRLCVWSAPTPCDGVTDACHLSTLQLGM